MDGHSGNALFSNSAKEINGYFGGTKDINVVESITIATYVGIQSEWASIPVTDVSTFKDIHLIITSHLTSPAT